MPPVKTATAAQAATATRKPRPQPSRKGKAAWRRNVDHSSVEEHLEQQRVNERLGIKPAATSDDKDADLFQVDTVGDEAVSNRLKSARSKARPMKSLQALDNSSAVPALNPRGKGSAPRKGSGKLSRAEQDRLKRIAQRDVKAPFGAILDESDKGGRVQAMESVKGTVMRMPEKDPWQEKSKQAENERQEAKLDEEARAWIDDPRNHDIKVPKHLISRVNALASTARDAASGASSSSSSVLPPALVAPLTGQSYNPTLTSHNSLLQKAYEAEMARLDKEDKERAFKQSWIDAGKQAAKDESEGQAQGSQKRFAGMIIGDGEDGDDDDNDDAQDAEPLDVLRPTTAPGRKTRTQRLKEARQLSARKSLEERRAAKEERRMLAQLPAINKALRRQRMEKSQAEEAKREREALRRAQEGLVGERVGRHRIKAGTTTADTDVDQVQLGSDLSESLRGIRPEGNAFKDRYHSLMKRGLFEASDGKRKAKSRAQNWKRKERENHSYKRFV